ncbi:MAG: HAMP domain-containing histidine kinase [Flavobacteriales bacterium]|nr:HAMP domain-containing histidine kinase [Flavobacteriales bacterium]MBP9078764.1 HAMP domain-containing histidine kinase [Flavobacteriales bacterium]
MDKRTITRLIAAISVALLGLVLIQALWVRDTLVLKDAQFNESIDNALVAVSDRLARAEAHQQLLQLPGGTSGEVILLEPPTSLRDTSIASGMPDHDPLDELLRGLLAGGMLRDIHDRIDPRLLDSLLCEELRLRHLRCKYAFGVFGTNGETVLTGPREVGDTASLINSRHRTQLFRTDWPRDQAGGSTWWLHVQLPDRPTMLLHTVWPMLASAAVFLFLIAFTFGHALRTIFRQKRLGDIKNDLVNNLTHELKTPISTIALACEALKDPGMPKDPAQVDMLIGMIKDENKRLGLLVESVLLSAVSDQGGMRLRFTDVDMHALLAEVVRNGSLQTDKRGGGITFKPNAELAHIRGDRTYLTSIFYNLIDNAVKYCIVPPVVQITTRSDAQALTIEVRDNGIGIPRGEQGKIFDRLYRIPTGNVHNVKGFGLGLSYVKSVVERHGGQIRVESSTGPGGLGAGSCFIISLPFEHGEENTIAALRG